MTSPYLDNENRLADVIAAIQDMSIYKFYKLDFAGWADRIAGDASKADYWKKIFVDHPEIFRLDQSRSKASLVWRRSYPKVFDVDTARIISREEFDKLPKEAKDRISRNPLTNSDIHTLISSAIELSNAAEEARKNSGWWKSAVFGLVGVLVGALVNYFLK